VRQGDVVAAAGQVIRAPLVSILASAGRQQVRVHAGPRIAFAATGDEVAEPGEPLPPGRIFNANAPTLRAQILAAKGRPHYLGVLRDRVDELRQAIEAGLEHDLLILSGGVSMGVFDHVPAVLRELGVQLHFQKLYVKPGRPTVFGTRGRTLVFGLPGNPISTLYAFDQYVAPAIRAYRRHPRPLTPRYRGELTETVRKQAGRLLLLPCACAWVDDRFLLTPIRTHGSADVFAIGQVEALALVPAGMEEVEKGTAVAFRRLFEE
jgi:molybdopterin molybdotransferase